MGEGLDEGLGEGGDGKLTGLGGGGGDRGGLGGGGGELTAGGEGAQVKEPGQSQYCLVSENSGVAGGQTCRVATPLQHWM